MLDGLLRGNPEASWLALRHMCMPAIVLGTHAAAAVRAEQVVRTATVPVLLVRGAGAR